MTRATSLAVVSCLTALVVVALGTVHIAREERSTAATAFIADRSHAIEPVAREMDKDFEAIGEVLRYSGQLYRMAGTPRDRERDLGGLVTVVKQYRLVLVYDTAGRRVFEAAAPGLKPDEELRQEIDSVARQALGAPSGQLDSTAPFTVDGASWYRAFATSFPTAEGPQAAALLVDTQPIFARLRLLVAEPELRFLVLGAHGIPTPASAPKLADASLAMGPLLPTFQSVVTSMRDGEGGALRIPREEAQRLGLGAEEVVAAWAPVKFRGGHWSVAQLSSTAALRDREQAIAFRLGGIGGAIGVFFILFTGYVVLATRRSLALAERLRQAAELEHLHEMTEKILENVPTGVLALAEDGTIARVNQVLRERLAPEALGGRLADAFTAAAPEVLARLDVLVQGALEKGRVQSLHGEHMALFGTEGQYSVHAVPLEPRFAEARVLLVVEDLSEVRALESRLLRAEKLATVGVLAAGIAHEIGTPLGIVRGRAEYLLGKLGEASSHAGGMKTIIDQIDRVSRTIRELLDFSRGRPVVLSSSAPLAPIARAVAELVRFEADRRDVTVTAQVSDDLPLLRADPDQLQQVLVNLVMNALDACARGGHVAIRASAGGTARIEVIDDGCGIPEELHHQVFDPFFTTKKRGQGTGLGLAVAAQIVGGHGGEIQLDSVVGKGTKVTLVWPLSAPRSESDAAAS